MGSNGAFELMLLLTLGAGPHVARSQFDSPARPMESWW